MMVLRRHPYANDIRVPVPLMSVKQYDDLHPTNQSVYNTLAPPCNNTLYDVIKEQLYNVDKENTYHLDIYT